MPKRPQQAVQITGTRTRYALKRYSTIETSILTLARTRLGVARRTYRHRSGFFNKTMRNCRKMELVGWRARPCQNSCVSRDVCAKEQKLMNGISQSKQNLPTSLVDLHGKLCVPPYKRGGPSWKIMQGTGGGSIELPSLLLAVLSQLLSMLVMPLLVRRIWEQAAKIFRAL